MPHINEKIDFTVEVFIVHKNKVLLRKHDKYKIWLSVGGHIELDEDPNEAAIREVKEEVGLTIRIDDSLRKNRENDNTIELIPPYFLNKHFVDSNHAHITFIYFATTNTDKFVESSDEEISEECRWFTREELEKEEIIPNVKFYALNALEKLSQ